MRLIGLMVDRAKEWLTEQEIRLLELSKARDRSEVASSDWLREQKYIEELRVVEWIRDRLNI